MHSRQGFTLVELAVVLTIIGLLVGGVMAGRHLIRSAEIKTIATDYQQFKSAGKTFQDQYLELPGDMSRATDYWGVAAHCPGNNTNTTVASTTTCNGNGNGRLNDNAATANEYYRLWQHLSNAGLIPGKFTGVPNSSDPTGDIAVIGLNVPASKVARAGWAVDRFSTARDVASLSWYPGEYGNFLFFGEQTTVNTLLNPVLTPREARNIDLKIDDGAPATGMLVTFEEDASVCTNMAPSSTDSLENSKYALDSDDKNCLLIFKFVFGNN